MFKVDRLLWNLITTHLYCPQDWHKFFTCLYLNMMTPQQSTWCPCKISKAIQIDLHTDCACPTWEGRARNVDQVHQTPWQDQHLEQPDPGGKYPEHRHRHHFLHCDSHDHQAIMACSRILKTTVWATTSDQQLQFALPAHFITLSVIWMVLWNFTELNIIIIQNTRIGNRTEINLFPATWFQ